MENFNPFTDIVRRQYNWLELSQQVEKSKEHELQPGLRVKEVRLGTFDQLIPPGPNADAAMRWQALESVAQESGLYVSSSVEDPSEIVVGKVIQEQPKVA